MASLASSSSMVFQVAGAKVKTALGSFRKNIVIALVPLLMDQF